MNDNFEVNGASCIGSTNHELETDVPIVKQPTQVEQHAIDIDFKKSFIEKYSMLLVLSDSV